MTPDKAALEPPCSRDAAVTRLVRFQARGSTGVQAWRSRASQIDPCKLESILLGSARKTIREEHAMLIPVRRTQAAETPSRLQLAIREWQRQLIAMDHP
jgi:hypothetical protein